MLRRPAFGGDVFRWPFTDRDNELRILSPLVGSSMLELGNKVKFAGPERVTYKSLFEAAGFRHVSVDINGLDGALPMDLRKPLNLGTFDMVTNLGTSEHVSEDDLGGQVACWRNICEAMHVGSVMVSVTPAKGSFNHHATWYPQLPFFEELAEKNGMVVEKAYIGGNGRDSNKLVYARLSRVEDVPFVMPCGGMYKNLKC